MLSNARLNGVSRAAAFTLIVLIATLYAACSSGGSGRIDLSNQHIADFTLKVLDASLVDEAQIASSTLAKEVHADQVVVTIKAEGTSGLKAFCFELTYDSSKYTPADVSFSNSLTDTGEVLELAVLDIPGVVHAGQVLAAYPQQSGFSGNGVMATVHFEARPALLSRLASAVPTGADSAAVLSVEEMGNSDLATWDYANSGDYDQNSEVNIADLAPLGQYFGQTADFERVDMRSIVDGDGNGEINIADISPIGSGFGHTISGYNIYTAAENTAYPGNPDDSSTISPVASVEYVTKQGAAGERLHFTYSGALDQFTWVRPVSGSEEGTPSNLVESELVGEAAELLLTNSPEFGAGTQDDPYLLSEGTEYYFAVVHAPTGNVGALADYTLSDPDSGTMSTFEDYGAFTLATGYAGLFSIAAEYEGVATAPVQLYFAAGVDIMLFLEFLNPPDNGLGMSIDPFIVASETPHQFSLFSAADGDVTSSAETEWRLSDPTAGTISTGATAAVTIAPGYTGMFAVTATYQGSYPQPVSYYLRVPEDDATVLTLATAAISGIGTYADPYEIDNHVDYLLGLAHDTLGEVGTAATTKWTLSETAAGLVNLSGDQALLELDDSWQGELNLSATYNDLTSLPPTLWFEVYNPSGSAPPTADLQVSNTTPNVGNEITFDASGSSDPDGTVETFSYDCYGTGVWDVEDTTDSSMAHTYYTTGVFDAVVRVRDNSGATDTAGVQITVTDAGNFYPVAALSANPTSGSVPVTVEFDASASTDDTAIIKYMWDLDGDGNFETDTGSTSTVSHFYTEDGIFEAAVKVFDHANAWDSVSVELDLSLPGGNHTPEAKLEADPTYGPVGTLVSFNASFSSDPDSDVLTFDWDWDGNGSYDYSSSSSSVVSHQYDDEGTFNATVKVSDPAGAFNTDSISITTFDGIGEWHVFDVVIPDDTVVLHAGSYPCLRVVDGLPAIAYQDTLNGASSDPERTMFVRESDVNGTTWGSPVMVRTPQFETQAAGIMNDMEIVDGRPAICWAEHMSAMVYGLFYKIADDAQGSTWPTTAVAVDANGTDSRGRFCDLEVVAGQPAICYFDGPNKRLMYVRAADTTGSTWGTQQVVLTDPGESVGEENSMCIVNGHPAIATYNRKGDTSIDKLLYIRATDATGSSWGTPAELDDHQNIGYFNTLLVNDLGVPVVGCLDFQDNRFLYYIGQDVNGFGWDSPVVAATDGTFWDWLDGVDMALIWGTPMFSYTKEGSGPVQVRLLRANNINGTAWQGPEDITTAEIGASTTSIFQVNGNPAVAFYDEVASSEDFHEILRYAVYY